MRRVHAALVVVALFGALLAPRRAGAHAPRGGASDLANELLGACRSSLASSTRRPVWCEADASGAHGTCFDGQPSTTVAVDFCTASGAFARANEPAYVCGVRWADHHELVLPWRAGTWPADAMARLQSVRSCAPQ